MIYQSIAAINRAARRKQTNKDTRWRGEAPQPRSWESWNDKQRTLKYYGL